MPNSFSQLSNLIKKNSSYQQAATPLLFDLKNSRARVKLQRLFNEHRIAYASDDYIEQLKELFAINNPTKVYQPEFQSLFENYLSQLKKKQDLILHGNWAYYPWLQAIVHVLPDKDFQKVRTARNRNLINEEEQSKFYNAVIGIAGLSVGNSVALTIAVQGGARHFRLADFDRLALSNLNRIRAGVQYLGMYKVEMTARQIYELNPYAKIEIFPEGITEKNINRFFSGSPKLDLIIDEIDNLAVKCLLREYAKKYRLPLVMAADNGDNGVVDIERYDKNPKTPFFHNRMGKVSYEKLKNLNKFEIGRLITKHVGAETVTDKMKDSLLQMGKTIVSWPQLGGAALLNGSAVAYSARKILNNQALERNRAIISLDEKLVPNYNSSSSLKMRSRRANKFKKIFKI